MVSLSPVFDLPVPLAVGISPLTANALALTFTSAYVGSLYVAQRLFGPYLKDEDADYQGPPPGHRDHPGTMKLRMKAVSIATRLCLLAIIGLVHQVGVYTWMDSLKPAARLAGFSTFGSDKPLAYLSGPVLFLGPIYGCFLDGTLPGQKNCGPLRFGLHEKRNYLIGPLSEELLFRSAIIAVSILGGFTWKEIVFATPLWFGLAHVHHGLQVYRDHGRTSRAVKMAVMTTLFQTGYTTVFGWLAAYLYIRTGSVLPSFLTHTFCNMMGFPMIQLSLADHPKKKLSIWSSYLAGVAGFAYLITKI